MLTVFDDMIADMKAIKIKFHCHKVAFKGKKT